MEKPEKGNGKSRWKHLGGNMTNSDRIRSMTDEELAEFLASLMPQSCDSCRLMDPDFIPMFYCMGKHCETAWIDWLRDYDPYFWKRKEPLKDTQNTSEEKHDIRPYY